MPIYLYTYVRAFMVGAVRSLYAERQKFAVAHSRRPALCDLCVTDFFVSIFNIHLFNCIFTFKCFEYNYNDYFRKIK